MRHESNNGKKGKKGGREKCGEAAFGNYCCYLLFTLGDFLIESIFCGTCEWSDI